MRPRFSSRVVLIALAISSVAGFAIAGWPQARHDGRRTAQATGESDIVRPVAYWKRFIGGTLDPGGLILTDVDGDGADEVLMVAGGRVLAKRRSDAVVWRSPNLALVTFVGLDDVDGDGSAELLVRSEDRVHVLAVGDGALLWSQPAGEIGAIGAARLGDLDGDGLPELVVQECVCCRVSGSKPGFALSFASGVAAPTRLWDFPVAHCTGGPGVTLVDIDGRGPSDVVFGDLEELVMLDGATGAELARSPNLGTWAQKSRCVAADIDGARGDELVCVQDVDLDPATNQRRVFALDRAGSSLALRWSVPLAPVTGGALAWVDLVKDLDGEPGPEVVVSALEDGAWTTRILSAATGGGRGTIPAEIVRGVVPTDDGPVLLTSAESHLSGWRLRRPGGLTLAWTVLDAEVPTTFDLSRAAVSDIARRATTADVNGDGKLDLIATLRSQPGTILGLDLSGGDITELGRATLPPAVRIQKTWPLTAVSDSDLALAVASSDGILTLFGLGLLVVHDGSDDVSYARLKTGGFYAPGWLRYENSPRVAGLGEGPDRILMVDSRGSLIALDAALGSFAAPPRILWDVPGASGPTVVPGLASADRPGIACTAIDQPETTPPSYSVLALDGEGEPLWSVPAPDRPFNDVVAGTFDGDDVPDLAFEWGDPGDLLLSVRVLSGADGATLVDGSPVNPGQSRHPSGLAIGRFDADDRDDIYRQVGLTEVLSGADGSRLARSANGPAYSMVSLSDVDDDGSDEVVLHGGFRPVQVLEDDLASTLYESPDDDRPLPYGAVADCADRTVLVQGSVEYPARLKLVDLAEPFAESTLVLAGGGLYPDEVAAGDAVRGQLNATTVHQDLTGGGRPSAVVGSTDGWLYAIDPCAGTLDWSYLFDSAVGEAVFGDTDGDGRDEVLVTSEDGYLYTLRNFEIEAPARVIETDPWSEAREDLSEIETVSTLEATWSPIEGATRYEVAVVDGEGNYVGEPWRDAGPSTTIRFDDLPLEDGRTYRFGVRAVAAAGGRSVDTVSDGVWVHVLDRGDPPGDRGGCGCRAGSGSAASGLLALLVALLLGRFRRKSRTGECNSARP